MLLPESVFAKANHTKAQRRQPLVNNKDVSGEYVTSGMIADFCFVCGTSCFVCHLCTNLSHVEWTPVMMLWVGDLHNNRITPFSM